MRGHTYLRLALRYSPRNHGGIAYPPNPRRSFGRSIQREITNDPYIRAGAYAPLRDFTASRKIVLKRRMASLISGRLRGTFPLGLPECIRQTALPCVRGPDRASRLRRGCCWSATLCNCLQLIFILLHPKSVPALRIRRRCPAESRSCCCCHFY